MVGLRVGHRNRRLACVAGFCAVFLAHASGCCNAFAWSWFSRPGRRRMARRRHGPSPEARRGQWSCKAPGHNGSEMAIVGPPERYLPKSAKSIAPGPESWSSHWRSGRGPSAQGLLPGPRGLPGRAPVPRGSGRSGTGNSRCRTEEDCDHGNMRRRENLEVQPGRPSQRPIVAVRHRGAARPLPPPARSGPRRRKNDTPIAASGTNTSPGRGRRSAR